METAALCIPGLIDPALEYPTLQLDEFQIRPPNSFDVLHISNIPEYIQDYDKLFNLCASKLKTGGRLVVLFSDLHHLCERYSKGEISAAQMRGLLFSQRNNFFERKEMEDMLQKVGLEVTKIDLINQIYLMEGTKI